MKKIENKMILETLLKASLFGTAVGLLCVGLVALIITIGNLPFLWPFYFLIWMVGFAPTTDIYFAVNFPTDRRIAARLDEEWHTKEKFLTAETFKDADGLIIEKQRESAKNELNAAKKLPVRISISTIPALLFGAAFCTGGLCSPLIKNSIRNTIRDPEKVDDKVDDYVKEAVDLIVKSGAAKDLQEELLKILDNLQGQLEGDTDIPSRQAKVDAAKLLVDEAVARANTSIAIGAALLSVIDNTGDGDDIEQLLLQLAEAIKATDSSSASNALKGLKKLVIGKLASGSIEKSYGPYNSAVSRLTTLVNSALATSKVGSTNAMYIALNTFSKNLTTILKDYGIRYNEIITGVDEDRWSDKGIGTTSTESKTKQVFDTCIKELTDAIKLEATNTQLGEEVKKLMDQMVDPSSDNSGNNSNGNGDPNDDNKDNNPDDDNNNNGNGNGDPDDENKDNNGNGQENGDPDNGNNGNNNGNGNQGNGNNTNNDDNTNGTGATNGSGNTNYAGNDRIFEDGESQEYGNVIADKQGEAMNDAADGSLAGAIGDYFDELYGNTGNHQRP